MPLVRSPGREDVSPEVITEPPPSRPRGRPRRVNASQMLETVDTGTVTNENVDSPSNQYEEETIRAQRLRLEQDRERFRLETENTMAAIRQQRALLESVQNEYERSRCDRNDSASKNRTEENRGEPSVLDELRAIREEIAQHSVEINALRRPSESRAEGTEMLIELLRNMPRIDVDIPIPTFRDFYDTNPVEFVGKLERYFNIKNVSERVKMCVLESALKGRAWAWYSSQVFDSYAKFREAFLKEFNSVPVQVILKNKWLARRYVEREGSLQSYFLAQTRTAQCFQPALSQYEINYTIVQQLPRHVRTAMLAVNYADVNAVLQVLTQIDLFEAEDARGRGSGPRNDSAWYRSKPNSEIRGEGERRDDSAVLREQRDREMRLPPGKTKFVNQRGEQGWRRNENHPQRDQGRRYRGENSFPSRAQGRTGVSEVRIERVDSAQSETGIERENVSQTFPDVSCPPPGYNTARHSWALNE